MIGLVVSFACGAELSHAMVQLQSGRKRYALSDSSRFLMYLGPLKFIRLPGPFESAGSSFQSAAPVSHRITEPFAC